MKGFSLFSFVLGVAGGAALASWWIKNQSTTVSGLLQGQVAPRIK